MQEIEAGAETQAGERRALVVLEPGEARAKHGATQSSATFLAQLLAVKADLPQTRERRRAEPDEAVHRYELSMTPPTPRAGRVLSRAM